MNNFGITKIKKKCDFTLGFTVYMETVEIRLVQRGKLLTHVFHLCETRLTKLTPLMAQTIKRTLHLRETPASSSAAAEYMLLSLQVL